MSAGKHVEHFRGLTEIRGIAASVVLFSHVDQFHYVLGTKHIGLSDTGMADHAVTVFFVLSGFLITHLLLTEQRATGTIGVRKFYMRRILRIWPVYYSSLLAALTLILLARVDAPPQPLLSTSLFVFMLPNLAYALDLSIRPATPLWSVGVEEQYYLVWPWVMRSGSRPLRLLLAIVLIYLLVRSVCYYVRPGGGMFSLLLLTRIDCMAWGGILAYLHFTGRQRVMQVLFHPATQVLALIVLVLPLFVHLRLFLYLETELIAAAAGVFILNTAVNPRALVRPGTRPLLYLGRLSYGIYAYHLLVVFLLGQWLAGLHLAVVNATIFLSTVLLAHLSYEFIERKALAIKERFSVVRSSA
ncbi:MAG: acyltransferase [Flavobacteriales bacterium]|nr:acyltransferase [Flavobacteriales bacterium]MBP6696321.1 acyltransferase [Flavobacteriales bacterium]